MQLSKVHPAGRVPVWKASKCSSRRVQIAAVGDGVGGIGVAEGAAVGVAVGEGEGVRTAVGVALG